MSAQIKQDTCTACGECVSSCPLDAISLPDGSTAAVDADTCGDCGACIDVCPVSAISLE